MSDLSIMDRSGDIKMAWSKDNAEEVEAARKAFNEAVGKKKMLAFKVKKSGKQGEQIREFDPEAERILITPALAGG